MKSNKLKAIEKIRKLPKLKTGLKYHIGSPGSVIIETNLGLVCLYRDFQNFVADILCHPVGVYKKFFAEPIIKEDNNV